MSGNVVDSGGGAELSSPPDLEVAASVGSKFPSSKGSVL